MKRILMLATVVLLLALGAGTTLAQSGYDLFQKALVKERAVGDIEEALRLYQRIVKEFAGNHALAAKAQLRMGLLYDRLGRKADAQRAYQAVVNQYADQPGEARQARAKIVTVAAAPPRNISASAKTSTGLSVRQVWAGADADTEGAPSPDGRYLSFAEKGKGNLAVRDLVTGETRTLTKEGTGNCPECAEESIWSPDGKQIVYGWLSQENENRFPLSETVELRLIGIDGTGKRVLYRPDGPIYAWPFDWSSDGKYILAGLQKGKSLQIALISAADGAVRIVKTLSNWDWRLSTKMFLSPDGRSIVYNAPVKEGSPARDIFLLSVDGSREVPLVQRAADDYVLGWTPDGRGVLFASDHSGTFDAWFILVSDGRAQGYPALVRRNIGKVEPMGLTQRGSLLYSLEADTSNTLVRDVYIATIDPATGKVLAAPKPAIQRYIGSNYVPTWSPDGQQLAIRSQIKPVDTPVPPILSIVSSETGREREIRPKLASIMGGFHWSHDGRFLLVAVRYDSDEKDRQGIYKIDAQTGETTLVIAAPERTWIHYPISSPDGKSVFYLSSKGAVMVHNVIGGEDRTLFEARKVDNPQFLLTSLALSPNGQWLAFKYRTTGGGSLMVIPAAGGEARQLLHERSAERIFDNRGIAWTPDGRYIVFSKRPNNASPYELWRIPAEGGEPKKLGLALPELGNLSLNPDGRRLAFAAAQPFTREVWVMENFLPAAQTKKARASRR